MPYDHRLDGVMEPFFDAHWVANSIMNRRPVSVPALALALNRSGADASCCNPFLY